MSGHESIIDLLSDSDGEVVDSGRNTAATNNEPMAGDEIVVLSDADSMGSEQNQSQKKQKSVVHNPYAKSTTLVQMQTDAPIKTRGTTKQPDRKEIHNPYKKKRKEIESKPSAQPKDRKTKLMAAPETNRTELQAGLVFEEDVDHIKPNLASTKKSGLKQTSLFAKKAPIKSDADEEEEPGPDSAAAYVEHQTNTRIFNNLQPILFHDSEFTAGNPATIDGMHVINKFTKSADQSIKKDDFVVPPAPKCRCRPAKPCMLAYSTKGQNVGRPFYKCANNTCKHFSWAFSSYMLHWYRFGAHNGHCLVNPGRGFRAEDLVQGK